MSSEDILQAVANAESLRKKSGIIPTGQMEIWDSRGIQLICSTARN